MAQIEPIAMRFVLADLNTGLFLDKDGWTADHRIATIFTDREAAMDAIIKRDVKNVALALLSDNDPSRLRAFFWMSPNPTP
jgi:hypothetical protein